MNMNTRLARCSSPPAAALIVALMALLIGCGSPFLGPEQDAPGSDAPQSPGSDEPGLPGDDEPEAPGSDEPAVITVSGPRFTLSWDEDDPDVVAYRVYHRQRGTAQWVLIDADVREQQLTVTRDDLEYGTYEFAVSSVCREGEESALHHSFDDSANPSPWVLEWISG